MQTATCPNCDAIVTGPFCSSCGQSQKNLNKQIWTLTGELLDDVVRFDSRVVRTLSALMFKPGFLTVEYFEGRRARYSPPVRLYLIISFLFFFLMPALSDLNQALQIDNVEIEVVEDESTSIDSDLDAEFSGIEFDWLNEEENKALEAYMEQQIRKAIRLIEEEPTQLYREMMDYLSGIMFFMLPLFAVFLKLAYLGKGIYYAEHLLLALHNHSFMFIALMLSNLLETLSVTPIAVVSEVLSAGLLLWIPVYMFLSLRTVFSQSAGITLAKFIFLWLSYVIVASLGLVVVIVLGVATL